MASKSARSEVKTFGADGRSPLKYCGEDQHLMTIGERLKTHHQFGVKSNLQGELFRFSRVDRHAVPAVESFLNGDYAAFTSGS